MSRSRSATILALRSWPNAVRTAAPWACSDPAMTSSYCAMTVCLCAIRLQGRIHTNAVHCTAQNLACTLTVMETPAARMARSSGKVLLSTSHGIHPTSSSSTVDSSRSAMSRPADSHRSSLATTCGVSGMDAALPVYPPRRLCLKAMARRRSHRSLACTAS